MFADYCIPNTGFRMEDLFKGFNTEDLLKGGSFSEKLCGKTEMKTDSILTKCRFCENSGLDTIEVSHKTTVEYESFSSKGTHTLKKIFYVEICWVCGHMYGEHHIEEVDPITGDRI